jgi:hypothetical protein
MSYKLNQLSVVATNHQFCAVVRRTSTTHPFWRRPLDVPRTRRPAKPDTARLFWLQKGAVKSTIVHLADLCDFDEPVEATDPLNSAQDFTIDCSC